ncbi:MAG: SURF1 family protein [Granulosicoccus sp.]|nr:SURF1 family protein [Granulosicoccus sp.]
MAFGLRFISIPLWAFVLYLCTASAMLWLGNWQLDRAALKLTMQEAAEQANVATAVPILSIQDYNQAAARFRRISVEGEYLSDRQLLWDNRTHRGQAGYEVVTPLRLSNGQLVLLNRGWIAMGQWRDQLPDVALPATVIGQTVLLEGYVSAPSKGFASGPAMQATDQWPRVLQYFDYDQISKALQAPLLPVVVQGQALDERAQAVTVLTSRPEWLTANWQPAASGPTKHYSYAFQWFAMAAALTVITVVVNRKKAQAG